MTPTRRSVVTTGLAGAALILTPRARAQVAEKLTLVVTTAPPDQACHCFYYARDRGFYQKHDIDMTLNAVSSSGNGLRAILAGSADLTWVDAATVLQAGTSGAKLRVVSSFTPQLDYTLLARQGIATTKDLGGKRFAVASVGGATQLIPRRMIQLAGGDASRVQWVSLGASAARAQALVAGTVDATIVNSSFVPRLVGTGQITALDTAANALPNLAYGWEVATDATDAARRPVLKRFVEATAEAVHWARDNPADAVAISQRLLPDLAPAEVDAGIRSYLQRGFWSDGTVSPATFAFTTRTYLDAGVIKAEPPFSEMVGGA